MEPTPRHHPLRAGVLTGSLAAAANALLSLPLRSPSDAMFNAASVTLATLAVGVGAGLLWRFALTRANPPKTYALLLGAAAACLFAFAIAGEAALERSAAFGLPLAAVSVLGAAAVPRASRYAAPLPVVAAALAGAVALGAALAGVGDAPSGRLELPPR